MRYPKQSTNQHIAKRLAPILSNPTHITRAVFLGITLCFTAVALHADPKKDKGQKTNQTKRVRLKNGTSNVYRAPPKIR